MTLIFLWVLGCYLVICYTNASTAALAVFCLGDVDLPAPSIPLTDTFTQVSNSICIMLDSRLSLKEFNKEGEDDVSEQMHK